MSTATTGLDGTLYMILMALEVEVVKKGFLKGLNISILYSIVPRALLDTDRTLEADYSTVVVTRFAQKTNPHTNFSAGEEAQVLIPGTGSASAAHRVAAGPRRLRLQHAECDSDSNEH